MHATRESREPAATPSSGSVPLAYERPVLPVTRRQARLIILLLAANALLLAALFFRAALSPLVTQSWYARQDSRFRRQEQQQVLAKWQEFSDYTARPTQLVYAEDPKDVATLLASGSRTRVLTPRAINPPQIPWQSPALRLDPDPWPEIDRWRSGGARGGVGVFRGPSDESDHGTVFLHAMKSPAGHERLVWVSLKAAEEQGPDILDGDRLTCTISVTRRLAAHVFSAPAFPADGPMELPPKSTTSIEVLPSAATEVSWPLPDDGSRAPRVSDLAVKPALRWCIYAGQPDPADPSHLTILYTIDGEPGVIDGRLNDADRLMLVPRTGQLVRWTDDQTYVWDFDAPSAPGSTTHPARAIPPPPGALPSSPR